METRNPVRLVASNTFIGVQQAMLDYVKGYKNMRGLVPLVYLITKITGWQHKTDIVRQNPYILHLSREGDETLVKSRMEEHISGNRKKKLDDCPEDYKSVRDDFESRAMIELQPTSKEKYKKGFNPHEMYFHHMQDKHGTTSLDLLCEYIEASDRWLNKHVEDDQLFMPQCAVQTMAETVKLSAEEIEELINSADLLEAAILDDEQQYAVPSSLDKTTASASRDPSKSIDGNILK